MLGVVGAQLDTAGSRQRPALAADLGAGHVGQHRMPVGGREELDDMRGREHVDDPLPQSGRHTRADEQPHRVIAVQDERRVVDDIAEHGPGVGDDRDAVLTYLGDESVRSQAARQRDAGAADHRATEADQQPGLVMQRRQAVHRVGTGQGRGRGGAERRQRPAVVGDLLGDELPAGGAEPDERQIPRQPGVGPIPGRQLDGVGVDLFHVDDVGVVGQMQIAGLTATEDKDLSGNCRAVSRLAGSVMISVTPPSRTAVARSTSGFNKTATAPNRDSAAMATSALGRVSIRTPTCSPWRTPTSMRPRTTLSIRRFTAS